jgi:proteasome lid subunit RPN8/RPN11
MSLTADLQTLPPGPYRLVFSPRLWRAIRIYLQKLQPEEACGLAAGHLDPLSMAGLVSVFYPVENSLHSPVRFRMDPAGQIQALEAIEAAGLDLLAIVHSHPKGPPVPSETDLREAYYPDAAAVICSGAGQRWRGRAFRILDLMAVQIPIVFTVAEYPATE